MARGQRSSGMIPGFEKVRNGRPSLLADLHPRLTVLPLGRVLAVEPPPGTLATSQALIRALYRLLKGRDDGDEFEVGRFAGQISVRRKKKSRRPRAQKGDDRGSGAKGIQPRPEAEAGADADDGAS